MGSVLSKNMSFRKYLDVPTPEVEAIAKKHGVSPDAIRKQLELGIKVEMEHTTSRRAAREIARDHLWEIKDYYTRLRKMESGAKKDLDK